LKPGEDTRDYRFESIAGLQSRGLAVDRSNYELVYTAPLLVRDTSSNLNRIYETLNRNRPADFNGHSLSVSDVVVLQWRGNISSHYVDSTGFKELPLFTGHEKPLENAAVRPLQVRQDGKSPPLFIHPTQKNQPPIKPSRQQRKPQSKTHSTHNQQSSKPPTTPKPSANRDKPSILKQVRENVAAIAKAKSEPPPNSNREENKEV
jgi:hypothetical protein